MNIFFDENMPHHLMKALRSKRHKAESAHTLDIPALKMDISTEL
jgi:hypothetical protein